MAEFSLIVPACNAGRYLDVCIASVKAQRVPDWELIIVNDGSTDGSGEILKAYASEDSRIHIFEQENKGQFFARQKGIDHAGGEYLIFLDSDDELEPDCLSTLHAVLQKEAWDMILYTGRIFQNGSDTNRIIGYIAPEEKSIPVQWLRERVISSNDLNSLCIKAFRRNLFQGDETDYTGFLGTHCGEDKARLLYPLTKAEKIRYIPDRLYRYHHRADSTMHQFGIDAIPRMLANEMFTMLRKYLAKWGLNDREHQERVEIYQIKTYLSVYYGVRKTCRTYRERNAFRRFPWNRYWDPPAFRECCHLGKRLSSKERLKLLAAVMRL